jgi:hypothetical protein
LKRAFIILFILNGLTNSFGQKLDGVWMSYKNQIIDSNRVYTNRGEGILIDFDNSTVGHIGSDTLIEVKFIFKKKKVKLKFEGIKGKEKLKKYGNDSLEMDSGHNMAHIFRKLDLNHKLNKTIQEVSSFLLNNKFEPLNDYTEIEFTSDQYWIDKILGEKSKKLNLLNHTWEQDNGFWYLKEVQENLFLIFTLGQVEKINIYQILEIKRNGLKLKPLQETDFGLKNITELKTCL